VNFSPGSIGGLDHGRVGKGGLKFESLMFRIKSLEGLGAGNWLL
jgi:hypothetical protein